MSDWKWTGPAEPMLVLSQALRERGHRVELICPETPPGANRSLWQEASLRGVDPIQPIEPFRNALRRGDTDRVERLREVLLSGSLGGSFDIVQCWHSRDHVLAARALGLLPRPLRFGPLREEGPRLVRFLSHTEAIRGWPWNRWLFGQGSDGLLTVSEAASQQLRPLREGRALASTTGAVEFTPLLRPTRSRAEVRASLGVAEEAPLIGIVARMQPHRRFDLLLEAFRTLLERHPEARLMIVGRGSRKEEVAVLPAERMGLSDKVIFAGYRNADYADVLRAMDVFTFLVPGSDGTCRALLQAAAMGLPLVGTRRGAIPEIISNGQTGLLVDESPEALAAAWAALIEDPSRRAEMGRAAGRDALERFQPDRWAAWMERFYAEVQGQRRTI
ncbi:MAG: glycosyltransferase family 4 protein [Myxococcota bacterium]